jgi:hypothetical protein
MNKTFLDICQHVVAQATRRAGVPFNVRGTEVLLSDDVDGTQIWLHASSAKVNVQVIPPEAKRFGTMWWATETATGKYSPSHARREIRAALPKGLQERVARAKPLPTEGMYAHWAARSVVAFYQVVIEPQVSDRLRIGQFVRYGAQPALPLPRGGHYRAADWWAAVDRGALKPVGKLLANAKRPVLWGRRHDMGWYLLAEERWTGVQGPGLYVSSEVTGKITPEQAVKQGGLDIRDHLRDS